MKAFGPYMETLGILVKTEKHGTVTELENTGPALRAAEPVRCTLTLPFQTETFDHRLNQPQEKVVGWFDIG